MPKHHTTNPLLRSQIAESDDRENELDDNDKRNQALIKFLEEIMEDEHERIQGNAGTVE